MPPPDHSRQQPQAVPPPGGSDINELIGYKIERYWPEVSQLQEYDTCIATCVFKPRA